MIKHYLRYNLVFKVAAYEHPGVGKDWLMIYTRPTCMDYGGVVCKIINEARVFSPYTYHNYEQINYAEINAVCLM